MKHLGIYGRVNALRLGVTLLLFAINHNSYAQTTFTESAAAFGLNITGTKDGGLAFADYDNDGDQDVLINAASFSSGVSYLYRNDGGSFTNVTASLAPKLSADNKERQAVWGDLNNDGYLDFMRTTGGSGNQKMEIYLQDSATGIFGQGNGNSNPIYIGSSASNDVRIYNGLNCEGAGFFDFEGDGDLDVYFDNHNFGVDILRNNYIDHTTNTVVNPAYGSLFTHITTGTSTIFGLAQSATDGDYAASADVNNDGWVDLFIRNKDENDFFLNQGGTFTNGQNLAQADNGNKGGVALFDLDNDGDFDAIWTDNDGNHIFQNNAGVYTKLIGNLSIQSRTDIDGVDGADIDNDGDIDLIFTGNSKSYLFINQINSPTLGPSTGAAFAMTLDSTFNASASNSGNGEGVVFVDIDNDGDIDFYENKSGTNKLWINNLYNGTTAATAKQFLTIHALDDRDYMQGDHERYALGANIVIKDCDGNVLSGVRNVNGGSGHGCQNPLEVHFGLPLGLNSLYFVEVSFPNYAQGGNTTRSIIKRVLNPAYEGSTLTLRTTDVNLNISCDDYDADRDTVPNAYDIDDDDDGILDITEIFNVSRQDFSLFDALLYDNNNHGVDPTGDFDWDGIPNYLDTDDTAFTNSIALDLNSDGLADFIPNILDKDGDGIADFNDLDSDNDGIPDIIEANGTDTDGNGRIDTRSDIDGDGLRDFADVDDTDGPLGSSPCSNLPHCLWTSTTSIYFDTDSDGTNDWNGDTDNDSLMDYKDLDSDNDGLQDILEAGGIDFNNDGFVDQINTGSRLFSGTDDSDKDGWSNTYDGDTTNNTVQDHTNQLVSISISSHVKLDMDKDGIVDFRDTDSDGDGIPDIVEANGADADGNGRVDNILSSNWDSDNDGWSSYYDGDTTNSGLFHNAINGLLDSSLMTSKLDNDNDGHPNHLDIDSDNDGILDEIEIKAGNNYTVYAVTNLSGLDADGDGLDDTVDPNNGDGPITNTTTSGSPVANTGSSNSLGRPLDLGNQDDFDNDGVPNYLDIDSDNDGILDVLEAQESGTAPATAGNFPSAFSNVSPIDSDLNVSVLDNGDGLCDAWDANTSAVANSLGLAIYEDSDDFDADPDYLDLNSDGDFTTSGDTLWDYIEHFDFNRTGFSNDDLSTLGSTYIPQNGGAVASTYNNATDVNSNGIPDWFDDGQIDGTPNFLDPNSSFYADTDNDGLVDILDSDNNNGAPFVSLGFDMVDGTVLPYPVNTNNSADPDFRDVIQLVYLPVELLTFDVEKEKNTVKLNWSTASEENFDRFEVERSLNNSNFNFIGQVEGNGNSHDIESYNYYDHSPLKNAETLYYRLKMIDYDGTFTYSETKAVSYKRQLNNTSIYPNPARDKITITNLTNATKVEVVNTFGVTVSSHNVSSSSQTLDIKALSAGYYFLKVSSNTEVKTIRLLVSK